MYTYLLTIHSFFRWIVLIGLVVAIFCSYRAWKQHHTFSKVDNSIRHWTTTITHIQLILGLWIYFISPIVDFFLHNFSKGIHLREIRFFGMEHIFVMLIAITIITIGSMKSKRKEFDVEKHKTIVIWFGIGLLLILSSIPWKFLGLLSRPYFRIF